MALDTTDHAPEIAGFTALAATFIPWSVTFFSDAYSTSIAFRFIFGSLRFDFGIRAADVELTTRSVTELAGFYDGSLAWVATLWLIAAVVLVVVLLVGFGLLIAGERRVGSLDPVRIMGVLCLCMALVLSGATWLLYQHTPQLPIPIGVIALYIFGGNLLTIDSRQKSHDATEASG